MKKFLAMLLVGVMTFSLAACGGGGNSSQNADDSGEGTAAADTAQQLAESIEDTLADGETEDAGGADNESGTVDGTGEEEGTDGRPTVGNGKVGFSTITLGSEFFANLDDMVHQRLESAGYEVITISCEASTATQVSDIENLITMDCEAIFFFAVDPDALIDVCKKGREAGIKMYGIACTIDDQEAYDKIINTDQYSAGVAVAQLTADWIDETYPDAEDGSIDVAVIVNTGTVDGNNRSDGEMTVGALSSKVNVVESYDLSGAVDSNIKSQEYAEMMQSQYPDLKCVIAYGADASLGVNEVYMRDASLDREAFAIFGVDTSQVIYDEINASKTNDSLIRGTVSLGDDLSIDVWECLIDADLEWMDENKCIYKPVKDITIQNIDEYLQ